MTRLAQVVFLDLPHHVTQRGKGHLWQSRFASVAIDDDHMLAAARYVPMNPVRAGMVARPEDWR